MPSIYQYNYGIANITPIKVYIVEKLYKYAQTW